MHDPIMWFKCKLKPPKMKTLKGTTPKPMLRLTTLPAPPKPKTPEPVPSTLTAGTKTGDGGDDSNATVDYDADEQQPPPPTNPPVHHNQCMPKKGTFVVRSWYPKKMS